MIAPAAIASRGRRGSRAPARSAPAATMPTWSPETAIRWASPAERRPRRQASGRREASPRTSARASARPSPPETPADAAARSSTSRKPVSIGPRTPAASRASGPGPSSTWKSRRLFTRNRHGPGGTASRLA